MIVEQLHAGSHLPLLLLGLGELIAVILFLIPRTVRVGGVTFMIVLLAAVIFHVLHGEYSIGYLLVYAASTFAVLSTWKRI